MTTESRRDGLRVLLACLLLPLLWLLASALLTSMRGTPRAVTVIGPPAQALAVLAAVDAPILEVGSHSASTWAGDPGLVARLYAQGAWLVLDARAGCGARGRKPQLAAAR